MTGTRLAALSLVVPDYDEAIAFFCAGLGFDLVADADQGTKRWVVVRAPGGGSDILLARATGPRQREAIGNQCGGRVFLFLETDDFAQDQDRLILAGAVFEEPPRTEDYGTVAVWRDPFGNRWDLIERCR